MKLMPGIPIKFGDRLKELREKDGKTQEDLAEIIGNTARAVSTWETSDRVPKVETIAWLAEHFGVSVDYILGRTEWPAFEIKTADGEVVYCDERKLTHEEIGEIAQHPDAFRKKENQLSDEEKELLELWSQLDKDGKRIVLGVATEQKQRGGRAPVGSGEAAG